MTKIVLLYPETRIEKYEAWSMDQIQTYEFCETQRTIFLCNFLRFLKFMRLVPIRG